MSGFPLIHLDRHLKTLVQQEQRFVAMCEEFPLPSNTNSKEFERRITRIITPGTLIDEPFLNPLDNNYLLAIGLSSLFDAPSHMTGLAWIDISTGEFFSKICLFESLRDELARIAPREVVLSPSLKATPNHPIFSVLANTGCPISYTDTLALETHFIDLPLQYDPPSVSISKDSYCRERDSTAISSPDPFEQTLNVGPSGDLDLSPTQESFAIALLTKFLKENLLEHMPLLERPIHEGAQDIMQIDSHTIQDLEIRESIYEGGTKGSLLSAVKRTTTNGGARLLARWLCESP
jgi:DNA mismatch repair ATPase MutS